MYIGQIFVYCKINKKAFQYDAYRPIENRMCFSFSGYHHQMLLLWGEVSSEQFWTGFQWLPPDVTSQGDRAGLEGPLQWDPMHYT